MTILWILSEFCAVFASFNDATSHNPGTKANLDTESKESRVALLNCTRRDFKWHENDLESEQVSELCLLELNSSLDESLNRTPCRKDDPGLVQLSPHLQNNLTHTLPSALAWAVALRLSLRTVIAPAPRKFYSFLCKDD